MSAFQVGSLIRIHSESDQASDIGKIVWIEEGVDSIKNPKKRFWWIELSPPQKTKGGSRNRSYIKAPIVGNVAQALKREAEGEVSFIKLEYPSEYLLTDAELDEERSNKGLDRTSRRKLKRWKEKRDAHYAIIAPIVDKYGRAELLQDGKIEAEIAKRALDLGYKDTLHVEQVFRRFLLGGWHKNALLPAWRNSGKPGSEKIGKVPTGRRNKSGTPRFVPSEADRKRLRLGWKKYKKAGVSVHDAYLETMYEYYALSVVWTSPTKVDVTLLPIAERPTEAMFEFHGPKGAPELAASRVNLGEREFARAHRGLRGSARTGIVAVGQLGVLDATSEDQQPVSEASRLMTLPSTWRTMVVDANLNYIFGMYRGFEKGGALAGLLAIENATRDKVSWAAEELDFHLEPGQLESISFKRIRGDAGDLKNETGIVAMTSAEISAEFTRSYAAEHKLVETGHMILHRTADHMVAGSTRGKTLGRGERTTEPCVTMRESWPGVLNAWIEHNNVTPVPELLTNEMRRANVEPTRQKILQFLRAEGYVTSEPYDLDLLRAHCLPRLRGTIQADGFHVFDPRVKDKRYIPGLVYWAEWMNEAGLLARARKAVIPLEISLNPSFLSTGWLRYGKMRPVHLLSQDPELRHTTLADWLYISDQDSLRVFLTRGTRENTAASRVVAARAVNKAALAAKREEQRAAGKTGTLSPSRSKKLENLEAERAFIEQRGLKIAPSAPAVMATPTSHHLLPSTNVDGAGLWDEDVIEVVIPSMPPARQKVGT